MKKIIRFSFFQIVAEKDVAVGLPTLEMEESEIRILWALCEKGPKSIYNLKEKTKFFLQGYWPKRVWINLPDTTAEEAKRMLKDLHEPTTYHRSSIYRIVRGLSNKNLAETSRDTSGPRIKTVVKPTFEGLILYLQNPFEKQKLKNIWTHYSKMIPFSDKWNSMVTLLGEERCFETLEQTVKDFVDIRRVKFLIRPLKMTFEGFLESPKILFASIEEEDFVLERDEVVTTYLKGKTARILRNAYVAYLAVNDIRKLCWKSKEELEKLLSKLESEKELAYFEKRQVGSNPLFKEGRIKEFLPRYSGIEWFLTGMFVKNLLWHKRAIEKQENKIYDFEVEFY